MLNNIVWFIGLIFGLLGLFFLRDLFIDFSENISKKYDKNNIRRIIAGLYLLSAIIIFVPHGVLTVMREQIKLTQELVKKSPTGYLCNHCSKPANKSQLYSNKTRLYFCQKHWPPPKSVSIKEKPYKGEYDKIIWLFILGIFIFNYFRALIHLLSKGRFYNPSIDGAFWAVAVPFLFLIIKRIVQIVS